MTKINFHPFRLKLLSVFKIIDSASTRYKIKDQGNQGKKGHWICILIQFGLGECEVLALKRGKTIAAEMSECQMGEEFRSLGEDSSYKYLGVLETDQIKQEEMKRKIEAEYFSRIRKVLKSKCNGGNTFNAINTWSVSLERYVAGIIECNQEVQSRGAAKDGQKEKLWAEQETYRFDGWRGKIMHGQHLRRIEEFADPERRKAC